jgi:hypothetical protein
MIYAARVFYNNKNWIRPTNADQGKNYGVTIRNNKITYRFGFEEWLFHEVLKKFKIGYLECYRHIKSSETADKILLYTKNNNQFFHVGNLYGVEQLLPDEIGKIRNELLQLKWDKIIEEHFALLNDQRAFNRYAEYQSHWLSNEIIKYLEQGFCINIRYKKAELFSKNKYVNLSDLDNQECLSKKWSFLSKRYIVPNMINTLNNNPLKKYLKNQLV